MHSSKRPEEDLQMSSDQVIIANDLSKLYRIYEKPEHRLKELISGKLAALSGRQAKAFHREFWALRNISFSVSKGETVGIVGRNGSGKSTLLQILSGTLTPTIGTATVRGRIAALLELGSGFNPEFTGRENIYLNGSILGLSRKEIDDRFDRIAAFADIGDFLDQPTKTYSSGMAVRLAFAVQAQIDPEILIVDEALAVGDAKFQAKCFERIKQLKSNGTSILLVTHSTEQIVTHCTRAILLDSGQLIEQGDPKKITHLYLDRLFGVKRRTGQQDLETEDSNPVALPAEKIDLRDEDVFHTRPNYNPHEYRWGDGAAQIFDFTILDNAGHSNAPVYPTNADIRIQTLVHFHEDIVRPIVGFTLKTKEGITVYGINSESQEAAAITEIGNKGTSHIIEVAFTCAIASGDYFISLGLASVQDGEIVPHDRRYDSIHIQVLPDKRFHGLANLSGSIDVIGE